MLPETIQYVPSSGTLIYLRTVVLVLCAQVSSWVREVKGFGMWHQGLAVDSGGVP